MRKLFLLWANILLLTVLSIITSGCQNQFDPRVDPDDIFILIDSLENTIWRRDNDGYTCFDISFFSAREANDGQSNIRYTYNRNTKKGEIEAYGKFIISDDDSKMTFLSYKNYGHPVYFSFVIPENNG